MRAFRYVLGRLVKACLIVLAVAILNFLLIRVAPGDPATVIAGQSGDADATYLAQLRSDFGLDEPLPVQLGIYLQKLAVLDFGMSYRERRPVADIIWERLPSTLEITATAFVLALAAGVLLGTLAAVNRGGVWDRVSTAVSLIFYATPLFWVGLLLVLVFSVELNWLPAFGRTMIGGPESGFPALLDRLGPTERALAVDQIVQVAIDTQAARCLGYRGFAKLARGGTAPEQALMKVYASEARQRVARVAAEVQGADALVVGSVARDGHLAVDEPQGTWLEQFFQSFANTISAGASEIQRNIIAERVLGLPRG